MNEIWKDIPNYEGLYQVSNLGRIKSLKKKERSREKILKNSIDFAGYKLAHLYKFNKLKTIRVHRLVLLAFKGNSNLQCNHINGVKSDNRLENLEYCTQSENTKHAFKTGLFSVKKGENNHKAKLKDNDVLFIRNNYKIKYNQYELASMFNVCQQHISEIINFKSR
jgi:hypothetical protein